MTFFQTPPSLPHPFLEDELVREYVRRFFPAAEAKELEEEYTALGNRIVSELYPLALRERNSKPQLTQWGPWGRRIDRIETPEAWKLYGRIATEQGLIWRGHPTEPRPLARLDQFLRVLLLNRVTHTYNCPLAMTDGTVETLKRHGGEAIHARALPRLLSRTPGEAWTAGQWMTERAGGSDVGLSETVARQEGDEWRLYGTKWFTSATTSEIALTLARPEGNPPGGKGLALFYVEQRDANGELQGIQVNRLKDKMGTWMLPTAELTLDGTPGIPLAGVSDGIKSITPLLNITRTWNSVVASAVLRHGFLLARDYASKRVAFGRPIAEQPLHQDTLAGIQASSEATFHLAFTLVRLLGKQASGCASEPERKALRLLFPLVKLSTAKMAVTGASEILESFGGAGYIEDTGIPSILRDAQVLSIWEGTTNVLSLDALRAIAREDALSGFLEVAGGLRKGVSSPEFSPLAERAIETLQKAGKWLQGNQSSPDRLQQGARRFSRTLSDSFALLLMCDHGQWVQQEESGRERGAEIAQRFFEEGIDHFIASDTSD